MSKKIASKTKKVSKPKLTGFDRYLEARLKDKSFREGFEAALLELQQPSPVAQSLRTVFAMEVIRCDICSEKSPLSAWKDDLVRCPLCDGGGFSRAEMLGLDDDD